MTVLSPEGARWWVRGTRAEAAVDALLAFPAAAALDDADVQVAAALAARAGLDDAEVLLALALASRAPRLGHVCVDLLGEVANVSEEALPADRAGWRDRVSSCAVVSPDAGASTPFVLWGSRLYPARYHDHEVALARRLMAAFGVAAPVADPALLRTGLHALFPPRPDDPEAEVPDRQQRAAAMAVTGRFTVISGGPGTGKTHTVRNLLALLYAQAVAHGDPSGPRVALAAPTGKAAARMAQALRANLAPALASAHAAMPPGASVDGFRVFLEGLVPSTLHRLLGLRPDGSGRARHGPDQPLPHAVVIVDEASMVDVAMMRRLVDAVRVDARLILLGDRNQLASVEAGSVLADLCAPVIAAAGASSSTPSSGRSFGRSSGPSSGLSSDPLSAGRRAGLVGLGLGVDDVAEVPRPGPWDGVTLLRRSRRFPPDSGIGAFASACVVGAVDRAVAVLAPWPGGVVAPRSPGAPGADIGRVDPTPSGRVPAGLRDAIVASLAPTFDTLAQGPGADRAAWLEAVLAAFDRARVLCATRRGPLGVEGLNDAITGWLARRGLIDPSQGSWFVGRPVMVTRNDPSVGLYNGDIGLVVPAAEGGDHGVRVVFATEGGVVEHAPVRLPEHETVFAMTIHKSQGSEHDDVFIVLPPDVGPLLTRELVYTGVTRARSRVTVLAREETVRAALSRTVERATGLADRLATIDHLAATPAGR